MFAAKNTAAPSGEAVYIESVFSTYLYTGNGSTQTITNGIDLAGKGGLVWLKKRSSATGGSHRLMDTVRGGNKLLSSNTTGAESTSNQVTFLSSGFDVIDAVDNGATYVSWTFRKQAKFFDVVTWTGNGTGNRTIPHSLGSTPGFIQTKLTSGAEEWWNHHRSVTSPNANWWRNYGTLSTTNAFSDWGDNSGLYQSPDATNLYIGSFYNASGKTYVAYLFAHDAGGFGATGTDNVISCGSYTGNGSATGPSINLGYEPQWIITKNATTAGFNWNIIDVMRGMPVGSGDLALQANLSNAESGALDWIAPTATGFNITSSNSQINESGATIIYIAIRRGPMKTPTSGTSVFNAIARSGTNAAATVTGVGFPPDLALTGSRNGAGHTFIDRLRGTPLLITHLTNAEATYSNEITSFNMDGISLGNNTGGGYTNLSGQTYIPWYFRRAPGFFDEVCYTGNGTNRTVTHNLGVVPELMIMKRRDDSSNWRVYAAAIGNTKNLELNSDLASATASSVWNDTSPTASVFTVGTNINVNGNTYTYVAYLFASVTGVSKVGSYTGNGTNQTINCGFTAGARFVMIKRTDSTGDWYVWDTARGIVAGNDPRLSLNSTAAEVTTDDSIDPDNSGFIVNQLAATNINVNAASYIFLAVS